MTISAVIPTRNRAAALAKTLHSLLAQSRQPDEILVIDSSDDRSKIENMRKEFTGCSIRWFEAPVSVCIQRNVGIANAVGDWIFLCDDDVELEVDYIAKLESYVAVTNGCSVVAGTLLQFESGKWIDRYPVKSFGELCWRFIFQLSVWGDVDTIKVNRLFSVCFRLIKRFYEKRGNTLSLAGWPLVTQWQEEPFRTTIFSLGANLVWREWLQQGYDEVLDPYGIGDNYGVALNFPSQRQIHVVGSAIAYHHRVLENRLDRSTAYYRRVLALHYFLRRKKRNFLTMGLFMWSLVGNSLAALFKRDLRMFHVTVRSMAVILFSANPYWIGHLKKQKTIQPFP